MRKQRKPEEQISFGFPEPVEVCMCGCKRTDHNKKGKGGCGYCLECSSFVLNPVATFASEAKQHLKFDSDTEVKKTWLEVQTQFI